MHTCPLPVVSIGNLTCGGNGKSPLCLYLSERLKTLGHKPVILSRGYGGTASGPHLVKVDDEVALVGDEPLFLARRSGSPVVISRRRASGSQFIARRALGGVILLDDGFQHRALSRVLNIVSVDVSNPETRAAFVSGKLLPYGRLREDRDLAISRVDAIVWAERRVMSELQPLDPQLSASIPASIPQFRSYLQAQGVFRVRTGEALTAKRVIAFCGLANPGAFFESLTTLGLELVTRHSFSDHYNYAKSDIRRMQEVSPGLPLVCSEKDAVKLRTDWGADIFELRTDTLVSPEAEFMAIVESRIRPA